MNCWMLLAGPEGNGLAVGLEAEVALGPPGSSGARVLPLDLPNPTLRDPLRASAKIGAEQVYQLLRREGYLTSSLAVQYRLQGAPRNLAGRSCELAFALVATQKALDVQPYPGLAATGILKKSGRLGRVEGMADKVRAALAVLPPGSLLLFPDANNEDVGPELHHEARNQKVELVSVARLDQALLQLGIRLKKHYGDDPPYLGLEQFRFEDAGLFFGRGYEIAAVCRKLHERAAVGNPVLLIIGASGSGKSSLVQAGVLPELVRTDAARWSLFRPRDIGIPEVSSEPEKLTLAVLDSWRRATGLGDMPVPVPAPGALVDELVAWLQARTGGARFVWVVDQLEELFTLGYATETQERFVDILRALADAGVWLLLTLRADFYAAYQSSPDLVRLCGEGRYDLLSPGKEALRQIIQGPAELADCQFEHDEQKGNLANRILDDVGQEPGALPLLEFALTELYQKRVWDEGTGDLLTHQAYEDLGRLQGAIGLRGEEVYGAQPKAIQAALGSVLRQLVTVSEEEGKVASARPAALTCFPADGAARRLVNALVGARLLILEKKETEERAESTETGVRLAHEALLNHWERAREILEASAPELRLRTRLEQDANDWAGVVPEQQTALLLPPGKRLKDAKELLRNRRAELPDSVIDYIEHSNKVERRASRLRRGMFSGVALVLLALFVAITVLSWRAEKAKKQEQAAREQTHAAQQAEAAQQRIALNNQGVALTERAKLARDAGQLLRAAYYSAQAIERLKTESPDYWPTVRLGIANLAGPTLAWASPATAHHAGSISSVAFSPDGMILASGSGDKTIRLWDPTSGALIRTLEQHAGKVTAIAFSPDGKMLASASEDKSILLWSTKSGALLHTLTGHHREVTDVAFSPDGTMLASCSRDKYLRLWDPATGQQITTLEKYYGGVSSIDFSTDGRYLVSDSWGGKIVLGEIAAPEKPVRALDGHRKAVLDVAFSPDGKLLASASKDQTIRLWDVASGETLHVLAKPSSWVTSVAFSPDGKILASGSGDHLIHFWDTGSGEILDSIETQTKWVTSVAFSPSGEQLASGSLDEAIRLWKVSSGKPINEVHGPIDNVASVAISPDGKIVASGSWDMRIRLYDAASGALLDTLTGHTGSVTSIAFSPDGKTLASGSNDRTIRLWDLASGKTIASLNGHEDSIRSLAFSPDGNRLVSGAKDSTIRVWDLPSGHVLVTRRHSRGAHSVAFSPDGKMIASGGYDNSVHLWDDALSDQVVGQHGGLVTCVVFSPDGKTLASGSDDKTINLWDRESRKLVMTLDHHSGGVTSLAFSPDGKTLASGSEDRTLRLWKMPSGKPIDVLEGHTDGVVSVAFSSDGKTLVSGSHDNTTRVWDMTSGVLLTPLGQGAESIVFTPDGNTLASGSSDNIVRLWNVNSRALVTTLEGHAGGVTSVSISPDGKTLASGDLVNSIRLWDVPSGKLISTLEGRHTLGALGGSTVAFSPDGKTLVSGSWGNSIRVWNTVSAELIRTLQGHTDEVFGIAISPDGSTLASGSRDNTIRLWDLATGNNLHTLSGHLGVVSSVAFSPDGKTLASASTDDTIRLWGVANALHIRSLRGHADDVAGLAFSPDGNLVASGSWDNTVRVWDTASGELLTSLFGHTSPVHGLAFTPNGAVLASASSDSIRLWEVDHFRDILVSDLRRQWLDRREHASGWRLDGLSIAPSLPPRNLYQTLPAIPPCWNILHPLSTKN